MRFAERLDGFQFDDYSSFNEHIEAMPANFLAVVVNDEFLFGYGFKVLFPQLDEEGVTVDALEKSRAKRFMNMNNTFNDTFGEFLTSEVELLTPEVHPHIPTISISPFLHALSPHSQDVRDLARFHGGASQ